MSTQNKTKKAAAAPEAPRVLKLSGNMVDATDRDLSGAPTLEGACDALFTPEKVRKDAEARKQPEFKFITSNRVDGAPWHIGRRKLQTYVRSGLASHAYYVTACSGQQLGSAWGQTEMAYGNPPADLCSRCREWKWKNELNRGQKITA